MADENPDEVERLEEEIRWANEELARREIQREAGRRPDYMPPRLPDASIPPHIRAMSTESLDAFLTRRTRDLEDAQFGWEVDDD